ncbi:MAG: GWxTD domain-containing protein [Candidatus Zixiibacteriota bacterium]|nr:MAG: GWxTD domain-containing protein [candidate division Zixibacteria bacterium]
MQHLSTSARRPLAVCIFTALFIVGSVAGTVRGNDDLAVYAGTFISNNPDYDSFVMIEFPFSLNRDQLSFFVPDSADGGLYARIFAQVDLFDTTGFAVDSIATYFSVRVASQEEAERRDYRIFNQLSLLARPGVYMARLTVIDVVSKNDGTFFFERIVAEPAVRDRISIGGAHLAYNIRYVGEDNLDFNRQLTKNGFYILPNPVSIFTPRDTVLFVYSEIYNLRFSSETTSGYQLEISTLDSTGSLFEGYGARIGKKPGSSVVVAESFDIGSYPLGSYEVRLVATDKEIGSSDTAYLPFHIVSPREVLEAAAIVQRDITMDYADLSVDDHVNMTKVLLTPDQISVLNDLSESGKMNYLQQYWKEHDSDPTTAWVENRMEQIERFRFCNKIFSTNLHRTDGWMTDRGRVYLKFGRWDKRDEHVSPRTSSNSFEVWYYYSVDEGKYFIFEDWTGNEDYRLVHSNVYGEVYSKSWQELMDQGFIDMPD